MMIVIYGIFLVGMIMSIFYTGLEIAVLTVNRLRLQHLVRQKVSGAASVVKIAGQQETYLTASLMGINIANNMVAMSAAYVADQWSFMSHQGTRLLVFFAGSLLFLFWAELLPKAVVRSCPTMFLLAMARPIVWSRMLFSPLLALLNWCLKRWAAPEGEQGTMSRQDLHALITSHEGRQVLSASESDMADKLFLFQHVTIQQVMVPLKQVTSVGADSPVADCLKLARATGYTRIPVRQERGGAFTGMVNVFDLIYKDSPGDSLAPYLRKVSVVNANDWAYKVLAQCQDAQERLVFVRDGAGRHVGLVTVEDLIEEILGEIYDEFDHA